MRAVQFTFAGYTAHKCVPEKSSCSKLIIQAAEVGYLTAKQALERLWKGISPTLTNKRKEMYAKYDFRKKPSSKEDEDEQPLYPRIVSNGTIDFQQIVKEIAQASSFTPADIEGVQLAIENKISEYLVSGHHVQLGNLGYFSAKLKARPVMDAKEIHAQSIYFDNVNFRPSSSFRKKVRGFVEKAKSGFAHSAEVPVEERRRRLEKFLDERPMILSFGGSLGAEKINEAMGGVLFIDEAYSLAKGETDFGQEAIDTLLKAMEDNRDDFVVIVAGYTKQMEAFLLSNPGLKSRFNKSILFEDYTEKELLDIFNLFCHKYGLWLSEDATSYLKVFLSTICSKKTENFANAREIRNLFERSIVNQANRLGDLATISNDELGEIVSSDLDIS